MHRPPSTSSTTPVRKFDLVAGEKERRLTDVLGRRKPAERHSRLEGGALLRRVLAHEHREQRRLAGDGGERADADLVGRKLDRHRFRHHMHRALRSIVDGQPGAGTQTRGRANVDKDAAAVGAHMRDEGLGGEQDRFDVDGEDPIEFRLLNLHERFVAMRRAGVVDDNVDASERIDGRMRCALHIGAV